uniref:Uncharacterized protein n=1 Tax=Anguilla anguilla TaxID=7936 RepID=A0A0E9Q4B9_ANGAN
MVICRPGANILPNVDLVQKYGYLPLPVYVSVYTRLEDPPGKLTFCLVLHSICIITIIYADYAAITRSLYYIIIKQE